MTRKLLMFVGMLVVCACSLFVRPALAFPFCGPSYCPTHQSSPCQCPPGTKAYPRGVAPCDSWNADCNFL